MSDRVEAFLVAAGWSEANRAPLAGDMSPRRYTRLSRSGGSAILMDAGTSQRAFVEMTDWLRNLGLSAPRILAEDAENGLVLLEDFGNLSLTRLLAENPAQAEAVYSACVDLLVEIRNAAPPPLKQPDARELVAWTNMARHYPGVDDAALAPLRQTLQALLSKALTRGVTVSLRDFHADNLMWLADRTGMCRLGLLDYQDAFLTHPCYDLVSLTSDARTDVAADLRQHAVEMWLELTGDAAEPFLEAFAAFSAQRNLRILGLFTKADRRLDALPRVYGYFKEALGHPAFDAVRDQSLAALPEPKQ